MSNRTDKSEFVVNCGEVGNGVGPGGFSTKRVCVVFD